VITTQRKALVAGAFVMGAVALGVAAIVAFGPSGLFQKRYEFVLYFQNSVSGLDVGAPVKFRGVSVGRVRAIGLVLEATQTGQVRIPIDIELDPDRIRGEGLEDPKSLAKLIANGLRGRLETQSFITGLRCVNLDFRPETEAVFLGPKSNSGKEIPTVPGEFEMATEELQRLVSHLEAADLAGLVVRLSKTADAITNFVNSKEIPRALVSIRVAMEQVSSTVKALEQPSSVSLAAIGQAASQVEKAAENIAGVAAPNGPLDDHVAEVLAEVTRAARAIRTLADAIERDPSAIVFGKKGDDAK
jgi:paraquat-inducible protein B